MMSNEIKYYNYSICKQCGGKCCKKIAGSYVPEDLKKPITEELIVDLLKTNKFAIDWWEGSLGKEADVNGVTYYVRPRHINEGAIQGSWGGICVNFTQEKGCSLSESDRPYQCRMLVPNEDLSGSCRSLPIDKSDKEEIAKRWLPYQDTIHNAIKSYEEIIQNN